MKNAEWMLKNGMEFSKLYWEYSNGKNVVYYLNGNVCKKVYSEECTIAKNLILKWLDMEHEEPILDDVEKRYLKGFIRPFRDRVQSISKEGNSIVEWLSFKLVNNAPFELPFFKSGRMYKNMERGKEYTLDELGL